MAITKQVKQQTSQQIQQLRWEIASAKSQAMLTMEIDKFLKADSKRTIQTHVDDGSISEFSAGEGFREKLTKIPSAATVTTFSANSDYSAGNFSKQSSGRSCTCSTLKTKSSRDSSTASFDKRSSKMSPRSTIDEMDFNCDFSAGSLTRPCTRLLSPSRISNATIDESTSLVPSHASAPPQPPFARLDIEFVRNGNRPLPPTEISFDVKRKPAISRGRSEQFQLYRLCEQGDFSGLRCWFDGKSQECMEQAILVKGDGGRDSGMTALHMLCSKNPPIYLVYQFVMAAPDACRIADSAGRLAVHHAIISGADSRVIDLLVKAYPESLLVVDKTGLIPIGDSSSTA